MTRTANTLPPSAPLIYRGAPPSQPGDILAWAEANVRLIGSVRSERYDRNITPWTIEPIQRIADDATKIITLVKPVQSGGSRVGLIGLCWFAKFGHGHIQYNWEKDEKAEAKWENETLPTLEACGALEWSQERFAAVKCYAKFLRSFIRAQGVFLPENLDSDSIPYQVNEEIHSWKPGHLAKARGRQTAVWFPKAIDISNAGIEGDQLHQAFEAGTMQEWQVKCPGCGQFHTMRTRWEDKKPELGGLRYDSDGCKLPSGRFDYNKLERTIRYQMPCGYPVRDNPTERRALSLSGRYSEPLNEGAHLSHRSYTYDAVSVDFIPWLQLIQEKHQALRALKAGDEIPFQKYVQERECRFYSHEHRPFQGQIIVNTTIKKNRTGLSNRIVRAWAADKQKGFKHLGELGHYWLVIRDFLENCDSQLVFDGQVATDLDLLGVLDDHTCKRRCGVIDATWDTKHVLEFCYRNGINATIGSSKQEWFTHPDKIKRFYSSPKPIHAELNVPPKCHYVVTQEGWQPDINEPMLWHYNKAGLLSNLMFLRDHRARVLAENKDAEPWQYIIWDVPSDASEEYHMQLDSWERKSFNRGRSKEHIEEWQQTRRADHLLMCEGYIATMMDMAVLISTRLDAIGTR